MNTRGRLAVAGVFVSISVTAHALPLYTVHPLENMNLFGVFGMNNYGQVVGFGAFGAAVWTPSTANGASGTTATLPASDFTGIAAGINDLGQVVGRREVTTAVIWNPTATRGDYEQPVDLPVNGAGPTIAYGINSSGQVVGYTGSGHQSFLWSPSAPNGATGTVVTLPRLPGAAIGEAHRINDRGQVAGWSGGAYLWQPSAPNSSTGLLHNVMAVQDTNGFTNLINEAGWITGQHQLGMDLATYIWRPDTPNGTTGTLTPMPALNGLTNLLPTGINDSGTIVGYVPGGTDSFIWSPDDGTLALDALLDAASAGWQVSSAHAINDLGHVLAYGTYTPPEGGPQTGGFVLLVPIPEPGSLAIMCLALAPAALRRSGRYRMR